MKDNSRWIERIKSLLIVLLSASAILLLTMSPLIRDSGVLSLVRPDRTGGGNTAVTLSTAARPSRIAVNNGDVRYGVQYDQAGADELFSRFSALLGEALASSGQPEPLTERLWQRYLKSAGIYFDFTGEIPLSALGEWLQEGTAENLQASARRLLLVSGGGDLVRLCYQDAEDGKFYVCQTGLNWNLHLEPVVSGITGHEVRFAFEHAGLSHVLKPYTLIAEDVVRQDYTVTTPVSAGGDHAWLLEALDYTGRNHASIVGGELYLDGNDRLRFLGGGQVSFDGAVAGKYPVAMAGEEMTMAEAIEAARRIAERTIGARCGEAELYLVSAREMGQGYQIRFGYRLDGSLVWLYDGGWAAEFYVREGCVMEFTLYFRSYQAKEENALLLSMEQAALMLPALTEEKRELSIQYWDHGESVVEPAWVAQS